MCTCNRRQKGIQVDIYCCGEAHTYTTSRSMPIDRSLQFYRRWILATVANLLQLLKVAMTFHHHHQNESLMTKSPCLHHRCRYEEVLFHLYQVVLLKSSLLESLWCLPILEVWKQKKMKLPPSRVGQGLPLLRLYLEARLDELLNLSLTTPWWRRFSVHNSLVRVEMLPLLAMKQRMPAEAL